MDIIVCDQDQCNVYRFVSGFCPLAEIIHEINPMKADEGISMM